MNPTGDRAGSRRHAGASALTQFQRRRRAHRAKTRVRVLAVALGATTVALVVALAGPPLLGRGPTLLLVTAVLLAAVPLALRQQHTPWWVTNWRRGAAGERQAARILGRLARRGYSLLNDLQLRDSLPNGSLSSRICMKSSSSLTGRCRLSAASTSSRWLAIPPTKSWCCIVDAALLAN